jgi:hypothetical protein
MYGPASGVGTCPGSNVERKLFNDVSTTVARLAAREETVDLEESPAVPFSLVRQEREEHAPRSIGDDTSELVVLDHPSNVQVFDDDHLVFVNESSRELVKMVTSPVGDVCVKSSELQLSLVPVLRSFLLLGQSSGQELLASLLLFVRRGLQQLTRNLPIFAHLSSKISIDKP